MNLRWKCLQSSLVRVLIVAIALAVPAVCLGQAPSASVTAKVVDESDAVVPGATVTLENLSTGLQRRAVTDEEGTSAFPALPAGTYRLYAQIPGFVPVGDQQVVVSEEEQVSLILKMRVAGVDEAVLVTAQKRGEERLKDVPISISVLAGRELDRSGLLSVTDALQTAPGVSAFAGMQGGGTEIAVRGVTASGPLFNGSSPIGYYLDSAPFGLQSSAVVPDEDLYDLNRIEVLRGPQGTLYGASSAGGVIRILTNDANLDTYEVKVRGTFSGTDQSGHLNFRGNTAINVPLVKGKLAARAALGYTDYAGWIDRPGRPDDNDTILRSYRLKVNAKPADRLSLGMSVWSVRNSNGSPSVADDGGLTGSGTLAQDITTNSDTYALKLQYDLPTFSFSSSTSYLNYFNLGYLDLTFRDLPTTISTQLESRALSEEALVTSIAGRPWRWSAGLFYRSAKEDTFQALDALFTSVYDATNRSDSYAVFGELGRRFDNDRFEATFGLRYFHDEVSIEDNVKGDAHIDVPASSFTATTPRVGLKWHPDANVMVYGSYAQGFRSGGPQLIDLLRLLPGFPSVRPDRLHNYEIGTKGDLFGGRAGYDLAVYYMDWHDVQMPLGVIDPQTHIGTLALVNGASASGPGVDVALTTNLTDRLSVSGNASWNHLTLDKTLFLEDFMMYPKGARLNHSPAFSEGGTVNYTVPFSPTSMARFSLSAYYQAGAQQTYVVVDAPSRVVKGDAVVNVRPSASFTFRNRWSVTLYAENLTNENPALPRVSVPEWTPRVRPRTVGLQFDFGF